MSDFKSKLPDLKELGEISGKLFKDLKTSVSEIMCDYKKKRAETAKAEESKVVVTEVTVEKTVKAEATPKETKTEVKPEVTKEETEEKK